MALFQGLEAEYVSACQVVRLSGQSYAEVDPGFVVKYYNELKCDWYVINDKGCSHKIGLNMDYDNPLICSGWNELKEFYCFQDDVVVEFSYFGKNLFGMRSFGKLTSTEEVPSFHSRSGNPFETFCFDVQLTRTNFHKMDLKMDSKLQTFLGDFDFQYLIICGDNGLKEYALPLDTGDLSLLKFTCPLKEFCSINNIGVDDVVRFKFQINSPVCRCHVYKIFN